VLNSWRSQVGQTTHWSEICDNLLDLIYGKYISIGHRSWLRCTPTCWSATGFNSYLLWKVGRNTAPHDGTVLPTSQHNYREDTSAGKVEVLQIPPHTDSEDGYYGRCQRPDPFHLQHGMCPTCFNWTTDIIIPSWIDIMVLNQHQDLYPHQWPLSSPNHKWISHEPNQLGSGFTKAKEHDWRL
jgi:hypothetical protein